MLVLSRKPGESLIIGDGIKVTVVEVKGDSIKIGIEAPKDVPVWRKELVDEVSTQNLEASSSPLLKGDILKKLRGGSHGQ